MDQYLYQRTVRGRVAWQGRALHSGRRARVSLLPAPPNHGLVFHRLDVKAKNRAIEVTWSNAREARLCSELANEEGLVVRTPEHLLAALYASRIDNALIELDGDEVPILDGSARPFTSGIAETGFEIQNEKRRIIKVLRPIELREGAVVRRIEPSERLSVDLLYKVKGLDSFSWKGDVTPELVAQEVAAARSSGRLAALWPAILLGKLRLAPFLRGATLSNALLIVGNRVVNPGGLRMRNELLMHRLLDLIGDLSLTGKPIVGHVTAVRGNHKMNVRLVKRLLSTKNAWTWA